MSSCTLGSSQNNNTKGQPKEHSRSNNHRRRSWNPFIQKFLLILSCLLWCNSNSNSDSDNSFFSSNKFIVEAASTSSSSPHAISSISSSLSSSISSDDTSSSSIPWHSQQGYYMSQKDWDRYEFAQEQGPSVFPPGGRLPSVEQVLQAVSSPDDPSSNLVLALHCRDGIVVVSTVPSPPLLVVSAAAPPEGVASSSSSSSDDKELVENETTVNTTTAKNAATTTTTNATKTTENNATTNATTNAETTTISNTTSLSLWLDYEPNGSDSLGSNHNNNNTMALPSSCPIVRIPMPENDHLFAITAGNAVHSRLLRHKIQALADSLFMEQDDGMINYSRGLARRQQQQQQQQRQQQHHHQGIIHKRGWSSSVAVVARRLADHCQIPTQVAGREKMLVSTALLVGVKEGIWQVDPTGQFWQCHAAVIGSDADSARSHLLDLIIRKKKQALLSIKSSTGATSTNNDKPPLEETDTTTDTETETETEPLTATDIQVFLNNLSTREALSIACECIQHCMTKQKGRTDRLPFVAAVSSQTAAGTTDDAAQGGPTPPKQLLVAFSIEQNGNDDGDTTVQWYTHKELLATSSLEEDPTNH